MNKLEKLKQRIHNVIGEHDHFQCKVVVLPDVKITYECYWRRIYDAGLSDRRYVEGASLEEVFLKILAYEAKADVNDAEEAAVRSTMPG